MAVKKPMFLDETGQKILEVLQKISEKSQIDEKAISDAYDASKTYAVGDFCIHEDELFICTTATNAGEAWTAEHWKKTSLTELILTLTQDVGKRMLTATYDANGNGVVDNAEKVNGHTVQANVPSGAVFTDHVYDDSAVKKSITDETDRAKKAEEANTKLTNDLKTGITSGAVIAAKASAADTAGNAGSLGKVSTRFVSVPDNGARLKYLLFFDVTDWVPAKQNAGLWSFDGYFFSRRSGGFVSNNYTGTLSMVCSYNGMAGNTPIKSDNEQSLRLRTTSAMYKPVILKQKSTNRYYLALETPGNGRDLILFGIFQGNFIGTWVQNVGKSLTNGTLPDDYELYSNGYVSIPYERAIADKNGKDIAATYIKDLAASGNTITFTRGDGTKGSITVGS